MKRVLITGASGFVGGRIARDLMAEGYQVYSFLIDGEAPDGSIRIDGDITDPEKCRFPPVDAVIHCAGILESSHPSKELLIKVNVDGTKNVFNEAIRSGAKNFIFMSTIMALGPQGTRYKPMTEDMDPKPTEDYGRSKLECERFFSERSKKENISIIALRPPVLYGSGMNNNSSAMRTFKAIINGSMPLVGNGSTVLNMLYVGNLSHAVSRSLKAKPGFTIYHVNEGPYTQREVIETVSRVFGIKKGYKRYPKLLLWIITMFTELASPLFKGPPPISWTKYRALTTDSWSTDFSKIRNEIGYQPNISLEKGIKETGDFYGW